MKNPVVVFKEVIQQAVDNDWTMFMRVPIKHMDGVQWEVIAVGKPGHFEVPVLMVTADHGNIKLFWEVEQVIFDHDFAKALWGDPKVLNTQKIGRSATVEEIDVNHRGWEHHLQQLAVTPQPQRLAYIAENI